MKRNWFNAPVSDSSGSLDILRIVISLILIVHPVTRVLERHVAEFGEEMQSWGLPFGVGLAWLTTLTQLAASVALLLRRLVVPFCISYIFILILGIILIHFRHGWYVVGGGRNGMEYSCTLIGCLFAILWGYWPRQVSGVVIAPSRGASPSSV